MIASLVVPLPRLPICFQAAVNQFIDKVSAGAGRAFPLEVDLRGRYGRGGERWGCRRPKLRPADRGLQDLQDGTGETLVQRCGDY